MPVCSIHLLSLHPSTTIQQFLSTLRTQTSLKPLTISRVIRWIILPTSISIPELLARNIHWDILLILPSATNPLPDILQKHIQHEFTLQVGIPSRLVQNFHAKNEKLLRPRESDIPPLTGSLDKPIIETTSQDLSLSPELRSWISTSSAPAGAISMLNLLAFNPGAKESYLKYGAEFAKSIGSKRGGDAKLVGNITGEGKEWDEMALAHYPSLQHFADMLASEDYQAVNRKYRVPSLKDTCILCTSELGLDEGVGGGAKL